MNHENDKLKFGAPGDAIVMACTPNVNPNDDSVRYYGGILVCESASAEWRRRIVACVNACVGISTENLEDNNPIIELAKAYNEALRQRDELLSALDVFIDSHEECEGFDGFTAQIVSMDDYHKALEAIEKVACVQQSAESETQSSLTRIDETQTSIPAIVFYPAGSLGEAVEEWGSHGA